MITATETEPTKARQTIPVTFKTRDDSEQVAIVLASGLRCYHRRVTMAAMALMNTVAEAYDLFVWELYRRTRAARIREARQVAMYLMRDHLKLSSIQVGWLLGDMDHSTVLHAVKAVGKQLDVDRKFRAKLTCIRRKLPFI